MKMAVEDPAMSPSGESSASLKKRSIFRKAAANSGGPRRMVRDYFPAVVLVVGIMIFWENFNALFNQPDYILPPLSKVISTAVDQAGDKFLPASWVTFQEVLIGFVIAALLGIVLGAILTESRTIRRALFPIVISSQTVPILAIAPVLVIWFGFGMFPKIVIVVLITFFPVTIMTVTGLESIHRDMVNLLRSLSATRWQMFFRVRFPAALPFIFAGLKTSAVISVIGAFVGEYAGATEGLAPVMIIANSSFQTEVVFAAILYLSAMGVFMYGALLLIERRVIPWHYLTQDSG